MLQPTGFVSAGETGFPESSRASG